MTSSPFLFKRPVVLSWSAVVSILGALACFTPLLETLGYEHSLLFSLVASAGAGHIASVYPKHLRLMQVAPTQSVFELYGRVMVTTSVLWALPLLFSLLSALRTTPCNLLEGASFYLLMPLFSVAFASAAGLFLGLAFPSSKMSVFVWYLVYLAILTASLIEFYTSPAVFLFGPLHGYFPGVLYDRVIRIEPRFLTYRLLTAAQILVLLSLSQWLFQPSSIRMSLRTIRLTSRWALLTGAFAAACLALSLAGPALGHRSSRSMIVEELSLVYKAPGLEAHFPPQTDPQLAEELTADARFGLHQVQKYFGVTYLETIHVFFFEDTSQKARLMGAAGTNVAKPWRKAVYVLVGTAPHEILRHELAHVVAGSFGTGPFDISGRLGGLWPNPGLIEGVAVAAQGPRGSMTTHQWAAAMRRLELLPSLESIFSFGFFGQNASSSYTAAGSFCSWVRANFGPNALRRVYERGDWRAATGTPLRELEKRWHDFIDTISLKDHEIEAASHRFDRPPIVHTKCVHEVARLETMAAELLSNKRWDRALHLLERAHDVSGESTRTRLGLFFSRLDAAVIDDFERKAHELLEDPSIAAVTKDTIREIVADRLWKRHESARAGALYRELAERAPRQSVRRSLEVKAHLATLPPALLGRTPDVLARRPIEGGLPEGLAMLEIARLVEAKPQDPVAAYLLGRQHFRYRNYGGAAHYLEEAMDLGLEETTDSLWWEGRLMHAQSLFHLDRLDHARNLFTAMASDTSVPSGIRAKAADWAERCVFRKDTRSS